MKEKCLLLFVAFILVARPVLAQDGPAGIEQELTALVRVTTRLVESLERQEKAQLSEHRMLQVQVAVRLLDIRVRQHDSLQEALDRLDDREQRLQGYVAANEVRLDNFAKQIAETLDDAKKLELEAQRDDRVVYISNQKKELEFIVQRRTTLQNRLLADERSALDIEDMVQAWVEDVQNPTRGTERR